MVILPALENLTKRCVAARACENINLKNNFVVVRLVGIGEKYAVNID